MLSKKLFFIILLLITIIAFLLRVLPFNYQLSETFMDTHIFRQALNLGKIVTEHNFSQLKTLVVYPYFFSYIFLSFLGFFYLIGIIGGLFSSSAEFIKYVILQMDELFEASRIIIAISGTLLVPLVCLATRRLIAAKTEFKNNIWAISTSLLAAILMAFSLLHVHFGKVVRPHIPVSLLLFLSFYFYLILLKKKNFSSYIALGLVAGAAAGTLQNGFLSILFLVIAHCLLIYQKYKEKNKKISIKLKEVFSQKFIASLIIFFLIVIICYPHVFLSPEKSLNLKQGKFNIIFAGDWAIDYVGSPSNFRGNSFITELKALFFYEPGLMIILLFLLVIYFVFYKTKTKKIGKKPLSYCALGLFGAIFFIIFYFLLFGIYNHTGYRMLSPLIPFLCTIVGITAFTILNKLSKKYRYWIIGFIVLILIFPIVQSFKLTGLAMKDSTQELALSWIKNNISPDKIIAIESNSRLRLNSSKEILQKRVELLGKESLGQRDNFLLSVNDKDYPRDSMAAFPLFVFGDDYDKIYEFLKNEADYLVLGRGFLKPGISPSPDYIYEISLPINKELIQKFIPFKNESSDRESRFPQEIRNPIIDLWGYERMGTVIEIYKLLK